LLERLGLSEPGKYFQENKILADKLPQTSPVYLTGKLTGASCFKDGFLSAFASHYISESSRSWDSLKGSISGRTAIAAFSGGIST